MEIEVENLSVNFQGLGHTFACFAEDVQAKVGDMEARVHEGWDQVQRSFEQRVEQQAGLTQQLLQTHEQAKSRRLW